MDLEGRVAHLYGKVAGSAKPITKTVHSLATLESKVFNWYSRQPLLAKHPFLTMPAMAAGASALVAAISYVHGTALPATVYAGAAVTGAVGGALHMKTYLNSRSAALKSGHDLARFDARDDEAFHASYPSNAKNFRKVFDYVLSHPRFNALALTGYALSKSDFSYLPAPQQVGMYALLFAGFYAFSRVATKIASQLAHSSSIKFTREGVKGNVKLSNDESYADSMVELLENVSVSQPSKGVFLHLARAYEQRGLYVDSLLALKRGLEETQLMSGFLVPAPGAFMLGMIHEASKQGGLLSSAVNVMAAQFVHDVEAVQRSYDQLPTGTLNERLLKALVVDVVSGYDRAQPHWQQVAQDIVNHPSFTLTGGDESFHRNGYADIGDEFVRNTVYVVQASSETVQQVERWLYEARQNITDSSFFLPKLLGTALNGEQSYLLYYLLTGRSAAQLASQRALSYDHVARIGAYTRSFHDRMEPALSAVGVVDMQQKVIDALHRTFPEEFTYLKNAPELTTSLEGVVVHMDQHSNQGLFGRHLGIERYAPFDLEDKGVRSHAWDGGKLLTDCELYVSGMSQASVFVAFMDGYEASPEARRDVLVASVVQPILWADNFISRGLHSRVLPTLQLVDSSVDLLRQDNGVEYARNRSIIELFQGGVHRAIERFENAV